MDKARILMNQQQLLRISSIVLLL